jgi:hypothetical protein
MNVNRIHDWLRFKKKEKKGKDTHPVAKLPYLAEKKYDYYHPET